MAGSHGPVGSAATQYGSSLRSIGRTLPFTSLPPLRQSELTLCPHQFTVNTVSLAFDFEPLPARDHVAGLAKLLEKQRDPDEWYLKGGGVGALEAMVADMFGKEDAVFLPTGTMANSIALRLLCGERRRALVQANSHVYAAERDSSPSGVNLVPMAAGHPTPTPDEILTALEAGETNPFLSNVGAISLENPVNDMHGASIPFDTLEKISAHAKKWNVGMHWDGARALMLADTPGFDLRATAALFDTVYMSIYKYLGASFGAVLAGRRDMTSRVREMRRVYGGLIFSGWEAVLPVLHSLPTFNERYLASRNRFADIVQGLEAAGGFAIEQVPNGTNKLFLKVEPDRAEGLADRLTAADIFACKPKDGQMELYTNTSLLRRDPGEILRIFTNR
ncbi:MULTISPECIES: low specificity L-threonine aldolase [Rhizobium/Agrobacterium group]|nr:MULTISPECIES: beta-eliminating lyase-related protein [Rhizobium/Agrobacterium group]